jgi:hypothetical protein
VIPEEGGEGMIGRSSRAGAPAFARGLGMRQRRSSGCGQPDRQNIMGREAPTSCRLLLEDSGALHSVWAMLCKTTKPSFPQQFHSPLILLESRASLGSAWPAQASDSAQSSRWRVANNLGDTNQKSLVPALGAKPTNMELALEGCCWLPDREHSHRQDTRLLEVYRT